MEQNCLFRFVLLFNRALTTLGLGLWEAIGPRFSFLGVVAIVLTARVLTTKMRTSIGQDWLGEEGFSARQSRSRYSQMEEHAP